MAAATVELLISKDPQLLGAMRASRRSAEGLREVEQRIDALQPGLYERLKKQTNVYATDGIEQAAATTRTVMAQFAQ